MSSLRYYIRCVRGPLALTMAIVIIVMNFGHACPKTYLDDFRNNVSYQKSLCSDDDAGGGTGFRDFKPPKQSFIDYNCFFGSSTVLPVYSPTVTSLSFFEVSRAIPEHYPEVLAPPHPLVSIVYS